MDAGIAGLIDDLKAVRRGYGVHAPDLATRVGPALARVCAVADGDAPGLRRHKVISTLTELTDRLPDSPRAIGRIAFGLDGGGHERYTDRVSRIAGMIDRDTRTAQRRVDDVIAQIAETAASAIPRQVRRDDPGWHTDSVKVVVALHLPVVEVIETRRVVSHRAGLSEVDHSVSVARAPGAAGPPSLADLGVDLLYGGVLHSPELITASRVRLRLRLPQPLASGEGHEFSFRIRLPQGLAPFYVCTPLAPCDRFELTVGFGAGRAPERIWLIEDEFALDAAEDVPGRPQVAADAAGQARAVFTNLAPQRSYGLGWAPHGTTT
ncbi:hypothetical protein [Actinokineospora sp. NPDC004072]